MEKCGVCNDKLTETDDSYAEVVGRYKESGKIDKTGVRITYPYLEIAGNAEMTQNANAVISEAIEKIEDRAYGNSGENVILQVEYMMNYVSSKLISITFIADVTSNSKRKNFGNDVISILPKTERRRISQIWVSRRKILLRHAVQRE